jgi:hypothetical protein
MIVGMSETVGPQVPDSAAAEPALSATAPAIANLRTELISFRRGTFEFFHEKNRRRGVHADRFGAARRKHKPQHL